jgi:hypothetical protein
MSNSVLEHIPMIDDVLVEVARVLQPGAPFVFCVPNHHFLTNLSVSSFFDRIGMRAIGDAYRRFFNRISRHHHCDSPEMWQERLERTGFKIDRCWHYFSPQALHVLEWGHYFRSAVSCGAEIVQKVDTGSHPLEPGFDPRFGRTLL